MYYGIDFEDLLHVDPFALQFPAQQGSGLDGLGGGEWGGGSGGGDLRVESAACELKLDLDMADVVDSIEEFQECIKHDVSTALRFVRDSRSLFHRCSVSFAWIIDLFEYLCIFHGYSVSLAAILGRMPVSRASVRKALMLRSSSTCRSLLTLLHTSASRQRPSTSRASEPAASSSIWKSPARTWAQKRTRGASSKVFSNRQWTQRAVSAAVGLFFFMLGLFPFMLTSLLTLKHTSGVYTCKVEAITLVSPPSPSSPLAAPAPASSVQRTPIDIFARAGPGELSPAISSRDASCSPDTTAPPKRKLPDTPPKKPPPPPPPIAKPSPHSPPPAAGRDSSGDVDSDEERLREQRAIMHHEHQRLSQMRPPAVAATPPSPGLPSPAEAAAVVEPFFDPFGELAAADAASPAAAIAPASAPAPAQPPLDPFASASQEEDPFAAVADASEAQDLFAPAGAANASSTTAGAPSLDSCMHLCTGGACLVHSAGARDRTW